MTIPASARPTPPGAPNSRMPVVDLDNGSFNSTGLGQQTDMLNYFIGTSRLIPCNETGTNVLTLTMLSVSPLIKQYNDYDVYSFVAAATSTGLVTALVTTLQGALATLKVFKNNGSAQATTGDVVIGLHYTLTFVDSLDSGVGGFVLR
jgi:hypothetical protein